MTDHASNTPINSPKKMIGDESLIVIARKGDIRVLDGPHRWRQSSDRKRWTRGKR
jgi:hypothetical protein